jgi:hypothetical protein
VLLALFFTIVVQTQPILNFKIDPQRVETVPLSAGTITIFKFEGCKRTSLILSNQQAFALFDDDPKTGESNFVKVGPKVPGLGLKGTLAVECEDKTLNVVNLVTVEKDQAPVVVQFHKSAEYDERVANADAAGYARAKAEIGAQLKTEADQKTNTRKVALTEVADGLAANYHENNDQEFGKGPTKSPVYYVSIRVFREMLMGKLALLRFEINNRSTNEFLPQEALVSMGRKPSQPLDVIASSIPKVIPPNSSVICAVIFEVSDVVSTVTLTVTEEHGHKIDVGDIDF